MYYRTSLRLYSVKWFHNHGCCSTDKQSKTRQTTTACFYVKNIFHDCKNRQCHDNALSMICLNTPSFSPSQLKRQKLFQESLVNEVFRITFNLHVGKLLNKKQSSFMPKHARQADLFGSNFLVQKLFSFIDQDAVDFN